MARKSAARRGSAGSPPAAAPRGQTFRIGVVAQMTGVPAVTIRMWERRHQALAPRRTSKNGRLYDLSLVERVATLRELTGAGHAISTIAGLTDAELAQRRASLPRPRSAAGPVRVALIGPGLAAGVRDWGAAVERFPVVATAASAELALAAAQSPADALVIELDLPGGDAAARIDSLRQHFSARQALVVYQFASRRTVEALERAGVRTLHAPVTAPELARLLPALLQPAGDAVSAATPSARPARRFSAAELAALAGHAAAVRCECPRHLVDLVNKLAAFELYGAQCESEHPLDAAVHERLCAVTAQARRMLEDALAAVVLQERSRPAQ